MQASTKNYNTTGQEIKVHQTRTPPTKCRGCFLFSTLDNRDIFVM